MGKAVIAPGVLAEEVACTIVSDGDAGALELGAAQAVPRVQAEISAVIAEETCLGHVVDGRQADPIADRQGHAQIRVRLDCGARLRPAQS